MKDCSNSTACLMQVFSKALAESNSSSVWNSAILFCTRSLKRLRPRMGNSCWDCGRRSLLNQKKQKYHKLSLGYQLVKDALAIERFKLNVFFSFFPSNFTSSNLRQDNIKCQNMATNYQIKSNTGINLSNTWGEGGGDNYHDRKPKLCWYKILILCTSQP